MTRDSTISRPMLTVKIGRKPEHGQKGGVRHGSGYGTGMGGWGTKSRTIRLRLVHPRELMYDFQLTVC